jgi:hypothetical protein
MEPILNGVASVTLMALLIALAVYLRQVSADTEDTIESLLSNTKSLWPRSAEHTQKRIKLLTRVLNYIVAITPILFLMSFIISARLVAGAYFAACTKNIFSFCVDTMDILSSHVLMAVDCFITFVVLILIAGMWAMHSRLKRQEKPIRDFRYEVPSR